MRLTPLQRAVLCSEENSEMSITGADGVLWARLLLGRRPDLGLELVQTTGVLQQTFPELQSMVGFGGRDQGHKDLWAHVKQVVKQSEARPEIRWAALWHDVGKPSTFSRASGRITFHRHEAVGARMFRGAMTRVQLLEKSLVSKVYFLVRNLDSVESYGSDWTESAIRRLNKDLGGHRDDVILLAHADVTSSHAYKRENHHRMLHELQTRAQEVEAKDAILPTFPKGLGSAIMTAFNVPPSKRLGEIIAALQTSVDEGNLKAQQDVTYYVEHLRGQREKYQV